MRKPNGLDKAADNTLLVLSARIVSVIGVPVALAVFYWLASTVQGSTVAQARQDERIGALERAIDSIDTKLDRIWERLTQ